MDGPRVASLSRNPPKNGEPIELFSAWHDVTLQTRPACTALRPGAFSLSYAAWPNFTHPRRRRFMGLLDGKKGLILNIANDRSIAWHIANNAIKQGATCGLVSAHGQDGTPRPQGDGGERLRRAVAAALRRRQRRSDREVLRRREGAVRHDRFPGAQPGVREQRLSRQDRQFRLHPARCVQAGPGHQRLQPDRPDPRRRRR